MRPAVRVVWVEWVVKAAPVRPEEPAVPEAKVVKVVKGERERPGALVVLAAKAVQAELAVPVG